MDNMCNIYRVPSKDILGTREKAVQKYQVYIQLAPSRSIRLKRLNTLTRKIPYKRMPRQITVVGVPKEHLSIVYKGKEIN